MTRNLPIAFALVGLTGCTSLSVYEPPVPSASPTMLPAGFVYHLPAATATPLAYVSIADCVIDTEASKGLRSIPVDETSTPVKGAQPVTEVKFAVGADLSVEQLPDRAIVIDYRHLKTFLKTSSISRETYPSGMIKSVNASIEDQSPEAIADVAAVAGTVALAATGAAPVAGIVAAAAVKPVVAPGAGFGIGPNGKPVKLPIVKPPVVASVAFLACTPPTVKLVQERDAATKDRKKAADDLNDVSAQIAAISASGTGTAVQKALADLKVKASGLTAKINTDADTIAARTAALTLPLEAITQTQADGTTRSVVDNEGRVTPSALIGIVHYDPLDARLNAFLKAHFVNVRAQMLESNAKKFNARPCLNGNGWPEIETCSSVTAIRTVLARLDHVTSAGTTVEAPTDTGSHAPSSTALELPTDTKTHYPVSYVPATNGIIYIDPLKTRVTFRAPVIGEEALIHSTKVVKSVTVSIPQLGRYLSLPLEAGFGEKVTLAATFAEDGTLLTASYGNPKTMGKSITGSLKSLSDQALATSNAIEDRRVKLAKDRADILTAEVSAQASTRTLNPTVDPLADLDAQLATVTAQAAIAQAQLQIKTANAALATP